MGKARPDFLLIACGIALFSLVAFLHGAGLPLVPCKLDPRTEAWQIPFPIVQSDGTVQVVNPQWSKSYGNLRAVVRDDGNVEIVPDADKKGSGNMTVVLDPELAVNFNKYNFINLTSYGFIWQDWRSQGNLEIYNINGGKKKIRLHLASIDFSHKRYFGEYEFVDNKIVLSTFSCKRFLYWVFMDVACIACFLVFLGFVLMLSDIVSSRRAKKGGPPTMPAEPAIPHPVVHRAKGGGSAKAGMAHAGGGSADLGLGAPPAGPRAPDAPKEDGCLDAFLESIGDSPSSIAGFFNPSNWNAESMQRLYELGPLGQAEGFGDAAHYATAGSLVISGIAAGALIGLEIGGATAVNGIGRATMGWKGGEITFTRPFGTKDLRINPLGNPNAPDWMSQLPHWHYRTAPDTLGQGIGRHLPWDWCKPGAK